jgi:hypothetical protein
MGCVAYTNVGPTLVCTQALDTYILRLCCARARHLQRLTIVSLASGFQKASCRHGAGLHLLSCASRSLLRRSPRQFLLSLLADSWSVPLRWVRDVGGSD